MNKPVTATMFVLKKIIVIAVIGIFNLHECDQFLCASQRRL